MVTNSYGFEREPDEFKEDEATNRYYDLMWFQKLDATYYESIAWEQQRGKVIPPHTPLVLCTWRRNLAGQGKKQDIGLE